MASLMSTTIVGKLLPFVGGYSGSLSSVDSRSAETLGDYVKRVRTAQGLSTTDVQNNSRAGGAQGISDAYITRIENGYVTNVSPAKLRALAKGLGVSEEELFAVARGVSRIGNLLLDEVKILEFYRALPDERRADALAHMELEYKRHGAGHTRDLEMAAAAFEASHRAITKDSRKHHDGKSGRGSGTKNR